MKPLVSPLDDVHSAIGGFTLIELMTTVVLLGILAGLAVPAWRSFLVSQEVRNAAFDLSSALMYARNEATKRNSNVTIQAITSAWQNGWTVLNSGGVVLQNQSTQNLYANVAVTTNLTTSASCTTPCIVFNRSGRVDTTTPKTDTNPPYFKLTSVGGSGTTTRCLMIGTNGRINTTAKSC